MCRALKDKQTNRNCASGLFELSKLSCRLSFLFCFCKSILSPHTVVLLLHTNTHRHTHKIHDNNQICIIFWKSVYMKKYLNVWGFFYSFVYDTSLEMCLSGDVLL